MDKQSLIHLFIMNVSYKISLDQILSNPYNIDMLQKIVKRCVLSTLMIMLSCAHPRVSLQADVDPNFSFKPTQGTKLFIALKDESIEEKKFLFHLTKELESRGYTFTASDDLADYQLIYALNLETYKSKEYTLLSNPEFVSGTINGKSFSSQRSAYQYAPIERAYAYKELYLDLFQNKNGKAQKVWSGMLKIENDDYRKYVEQCVKELVNVIGQDADKKVTLKD